MLTLELTNYRRFLMTERVSFHPGLTIVSGPNGAGKSTLVEALLYALFGAERGQRREIRSDSALHETVVECELIIDGQSVRVRRYEDRADVWVNGQLEVQGISGSVSAANIYLRQVLGGLSLEQFTSTYVAPQGDTAGLVADKPEKRREIIESVLQLEVLKRAVRLQSERRETGLSDVKAVGRSTVDDLELDAAATEVLGQFSRAHTAEKKAEHASRFYARIDALTERLAQEVDMAARLLEQAKFQVGECEKTRDRKHSARAGAKAELEKHEQVRVRYEKVERELAGVEGQVKQIKSDIRALTDRITEALKYAEAAHEYASLTAEGEVIRKRLERLELVADRWSALDAVRSEVENLDSELAKLTGVDDALKAAEERVEDAKRRCDELETDPTTDDWEIWQADEARLVLEAQDCEEALQLLEHQPEKGTCPTCGRTFGEHGRKERIEHLDRWRIEVLPSRQAELEARSVSLKAWRTQWAKEKKSAQKTWEEQRQQTQAAQRLIDQRNNLAKQRGGMEQRFRTTQAKWDELEEVSGYDPAEEVALREHNKGLDARVQTLKPAADQYAELPRLRLDLATKTADLAKATEQIKQLKQQQDEIGYDADAYRQVAQAYTNAADEVAQAERDFGDARTVLKDAENDAKGASDNLACAQRHGQRFARAVSEFQREDRLLTLLSNFQLHFFATNTQRVAERAADLLRHAVTDQTILGVEFNRDELTYLDASRQRRPVARLSGGEKALVGLCLRIALAEQALAIARIGKVQFLILDEVLSSLDDDRREAVQRIFEDVLRRGVFEHIIMITHLDAVKHGWRASTVEVQKVDHNTSQVVALAEAVT